MVAITLQRLFIALLAASASVQAADNLSKLQRRALSGGHLDHGNAAARQDARRSRKRDLYKRQEPVITNVLFINETIAIEQGPETTITRTVVPEPTLMAEAKIEEVEAAIIDGAPTPAGVTFENNQEAASSAPTSSPDSGEGAPSEATPEQATTSSQGQAEGQANQGAENSEGVQAEGQSNDGGQQQDGGDSQGGQNQANAGNGESSPAVESSFTPEQAQQSTDTPAQTQQQQQTTSSSSAAQAQQTTSSSSSSDSQPAQQTTQNQEPNQEFNGETTSSSAATTSSALPPAEQIQDTPDEGQQEEPNQTFVPTTTQQTTQSSSSRSSSSIVTVPSPVAQETTSQEPIVDISLGLGLGGNEQQPTTTQEQQNTPSSSPEAEDTTSQSSRTTSSSSREATTSAGSTTREEQEQVEPTTTQPDLVDALPTLISIPGKEEPTTRENAQPEEEPTTEREETTRSQQQEATTIREEQQAEPTTTQQEQQPTTSRQAEQAPVEQEESPSVRTTNNIALPTLISIPGLNDQTTADAEATDVNTVPAPIASENNNEETAVEATRSSAQTGSATRTSDEAEAPATTQRESQAPARPVDTTTSRNEETDREPVTATRQSQVAGSSITSASENDEETDIIGLPVPLPTLSISEVDEVLPTREAGTRVETSVAPDQTGSRANTSSASPARPTSREEQAAGTSTANEADTTSVASRPNATVPEPIASLELPSGLPVQITRSKDDEASSIRPTGSAASSSNNTSQAEQARPTSTGSASQVEEGSDSDSQTRTIANPASSSSNGSPETDTVSSSRTAGSSSESASRGSASLPEEQTTGSATSDEAAPSSAGSAAGSSVTSENASQRTSDIRSSAAASGTFQLSSSLASVVGNATAVLPTRTGSSTISASRVSSLAESEAASGREASSTEAIPVLSQISNSADSVISSASSRASSAMSAASSVASSLASEALTSQATEQSSSSLVESSSRTSSSPSANYDFVPTSSLLLADRTTTTEESTTEITTTSASPTVSLADQPITTITARISFPSDLPAKIVPVGAPSSAPDGSSLISILFDDGLPWSFVATNESSAGQILLYMPPLLARALDIDQSQVINNALLGYQSTDFTSAQDSVVLTVWTGYVPTDKIDQLSAYLTTPSSPLYSELDMPGQLALQINPSLPLNAYGSTAGNGVKTFDPDEDGDDSNKTTIIAVVASFGSVIVLLTAVLGFRYMKRRKNASNDSAPPMRQLHLGSNSPVHDRASNAYSHGTGAGGRPVSNYSDASSGSGHSSMRSMSQDGADNRVSWFSGRYTDFNGSDDGHISPLQQSPHNSDPFADRRFSGLSGVSDAGARAEGARRIKTGNVAISKPRLEGNSLML